MRDASSTRTLITGASGGLGLATAVELVARGRAVLLAGRRPDAIEQAFARIAPSTTPELVRIARLDVSDLASVRAFAAEHATIELDAIIANAAVQVTRGVTRTRDGLEETFATNHLGHFALVRLLLDRVRPASQGGRVVVVASDTHDPRRFTGMPAPDARDLEALADGRAFEDEPAEIAGRRRYTTSKLCNVLFTYELARRLAPRFDAPLVHAFDPGMMPGTGLARDYGALARWAWSTVMRALTILPNVNRVRTSARRLAALASGELAIPTGAYVTRGRAARSSDASYDVDLARRLWALSSRLAVLPDALEARAPAPEDAA